MRSLLLSFTLLLAACGGEPPAPDLAATPEGRLCGRAYGSTVDSLDQLFDAQRVAEADRPQMPDKQAYVEKCVGLGFDEAQLKCLDPKIEAIDETCAETMASAGEKRTELNALFIEAREGAAEAAADEPAPDDAAGAVEGALGG